MRGAIPGDGMGGLGPLPGRSPPASECNSDKRGTLVAWDGGLIRLAGGIGVRLSGLAVLASSRRNDWPRCKPGPSFFCATMSKQIDGRRSWLRAKQGHVGRQSGPTKPVGAAMKHGSSAYGLK